MAFDTQLIDDVEAVGAELKKDLAKDRLLSSHRDSLQRKAAHSAGLPCAESTDEAFTTVRNQSN